MFIAVFLATCPYPESDQSNSYPSILFHSSAPSVPALSYPISCTPTKLDLSVNSLVHCLQWPWRIQVPHIACGPVARSWTQLVQRLLVRVYISSYVM